MRIDFALAAVLAKARLHGSIFPAPACCGFVRVMTTWPALLRVALALGTGTGSELRRPLGISIIGGLIVSQMLTLFTTPVVYLYLDGLRLSWQRWRKRPASKAAEHATV